MKIYVRIFPIAGLFDATQELEVKLIEGRLSELMNSLNQSLGADLLDKDILILHNGHSLDIKSDTLFSDGDQIWIIHCLSGG